MHTPGPWRAGTKRGHDMTTVYTADGALIVAQVTTSAPDFDEREANARLIAQAPAMLLQERIDVEQFQEWIEALADMPDATGTLADIIAGMADIALDKRAILRAVKEG